MDELKIIYKEKEGNVSKARLKNGKLIITLSNRISKKTKKEAIAKFKKWAEKKLKNRTYKNPYAKEYKDRGVINTHNCTYIIELIVESRKNINTKIDANKKIIIKSNRELKRDEIKERVEKAIIKDRHEYICELIDELNQLHFQEKINKITIKRVSSRLGSCSGRRNITIAYKLLFMPKEILEYVCIHELSHLKEMNHSKRFWKLVEEAMPEYKTHEKWLNNNSFLIE